MNLDGVWHPILAKINGNEFDGATLQSMELTLKDDNFTATVSGQTDIGKFKLNMAQSPTGMDIVSTQGPNVGKVTQCICNLEGEKLTVCYSLQKGMRPVDFTSTPENKQFLVVYQKG